MFISRITFAAMRLCSTITGLISGSSFVGLPFTVTGVLLAQIIFVFGSLSWMTST